MLIATLGPLADALPARALEGATLQLAKTVDGVKAKRDLRPGDSVVYQVVFRVSDEDADAPVRVTDVLPEAFLGWQISNLTAVVGGTTTGVTLDLPGITEGASPSAPASGTIGSLGSTAPDRTITVGVARPVQAGAGNSEVCMDGAVAMGCGMSTRDTGMLEYTLTVPTNISPYDPILRQDLENTVTFSAKAGAQNLSISDAAIISVDNPITIGVTPSKTWSPAGQNYLPGAESTLTIGATQASNVNAESLQLRDPALPAHAQNGVATLHASNPFNYVDFAGFTPADPTTNLPAGATSADVQVFRLSGGTWNWEAWNPSIPNNQIAGVDITYEGDIEPGTVATQGFKVEQRSTNRATGTSISTGYSIVNEARATVTIPDGRTASADAPAPFEVMPETIQVVAQKSFYLLPSGAETQSLTEVTAGDSVGVVIRGINEASPSSTTISTLTISEPGATGSSPLFFGDKLEFAGFDMSTPDRVAGVWPIGSSSATLTWQHDGGPTSVNLTAGDPLPAAPAAELITGFEIVFAGTIPAGAASEIRYQLDTSSDETWVPAGPGVGPFANVIDVVGARPDLDPDSDSDAANISLVAPRVDVTIDKRVGPNSVLPGQDVVVQLDTNATTTGGRTKPTDIVIEDVWDSTDPLNFWNAFNANEILAPIERPTNEGVQATLVISYRQADGVTWTTLVTDPAENSTHSIPAGATGIRYHYTNTSGLSQTTLVKPNISFTARSTLRDGSGQVAGSFSDQIIYENVATAHARAELDSRVVTDDDLSVETVGVRGTEGGTGPGPDGLWTGKVWGHSMLTSQSAATSWTTQDWTVARSDYTTVELQDSATPNATGAGTVYEAFNLTHIRPIRTTSPAGNGTVDPRLQWDNVTDVQLFDGANWVSVTPVPGGSWMNSDGSGFKGYTLTAAERLSTLGVRLVLVENRTAREAAADANDLTAPAVDSGVSASADIRSFRLDWQLRDVARPVSTPSALPKWVKETDTEFNCAGLDGCVDNDFRLTGIPTVGSSASSTANDTIQLLDGTPNVDLQKKVRPLPISAATPPADTLTLVAPNEGELADADYPMARYTLTAKNSSTAPTGTPPVRGAMKLGKIRVVDTSTDAGLSTGLDITQSPFTDRDFATEVASVEGNHFDEFTLSGVSFGTLPTYIDTAESTVELWLWKHGGAPGETTQTFTLQQVIDANPAFATALQNAIGISVTYSGTDPSRNGNRIVADDELVMHLDVQLRQYSRFDPLLHISGAVAPLLNNVPNQAIAQGWDAVINKASRPTNIDNANIGLMEARIRVGLEKSVSVSHGGTVNQTVYETDPQAEVSVLLTADAEGPGGERSTAPINTLNIQDRTAGFWDRFEFVRFETPREWPTDVDRETLKVYVGGVWLDYATYAGSLENIRGVGIVYDRIDGGLFPLGATSWNSSWGEASLPFVVKLRTGATVDWASDGEDNTATVLANNTVYGSANDDSDDEVLFSPGIHELRVIKRAPNDATTHQVDALAALPWKLIFTNIGSSYLPITKVTDELPAILEWDGEDPVVNVTVASGTPGLSTTPTVELSPDGRNLEFTWPAGSRMKPGETVEITLGIIMQPLALGQRATNEVLVETGVVLATCDQPTDFGQNPSATGLAPGECSNNNYVQPRAGTVVGVRKTVSGEPVDTLGENLVTGALDVRTDSECDPGYFLPVGTDYTRNPCASYSTVGATDTWKLENLNSGTAPLARMVVVDMLPTPGDKMLAGGAARNSTFRPVLKDLNDIRLSGLPAGATYTVEVTTNQFACVGSTPGASLWLSDPTCSDTASNPDNVWVSLASYAGAAEDISGLRFDIDMTPTPLPPAGNIVIEFETVNRVVDTSAEGLKAQLSQFVDRQFAWNQNGATAWDTVGNEVALPAAPQRAGVTLMTGSLTISKTVNGAGAAVTAPKEFAVNLECTVPSGVASPERVPFDLGSSATLMVPKNGTVTLEGLPIGADCTIRESGAVGAYGETKRSIAPGTGVVPAADGLSADVAVRMLAGGEERLVAFTNTFGSLPNTGTEGDRAGILLGTGALLLLGGVAIILGGRRRIGVKR